MSGQQTYICKELYRDILNMFLLISLLFYLEIVDLTIDQQDIDPLLQYEPLQSSPVTSLQSSPATSLHSTMNIDRPSSPTYILPQQPQQVSQFEISSDERSLTYAEFTYSINLINNKINSIYQLC
jgi:hypothetical protein